MLKTVDSYCTFKIEDSDIPSKLVLNPIKNQDFFVEIEDQEQHEQEEQQAEEEQQQNQQEDFRSGQLDYEIPDIMQQNEASICTVRIGDDTISLQEIKISSTSIHNTIEIGEEMSVKLIDVSGGKNFRIVAVSNERQAIRKGKITEWKISVTPLQKGTHVIFLRISIHFNNQTKDIKVLEKSIRVNGDSSISIEEVAKTIKKKILFIAADSKSGLQLTTESKK